MSSIVSRSQTNLSPHEDYKQECTPCDGVTPGYYRSGCGGHSSAITHLDWSAASDVLRSNDLGHELRFWDVPSGKLLLAQQEPAAFEQSPTGADFLRVSCIFGSDEREQIFGLGQRSKTQTVLDNKHLNGGAPVTIALSQKKFFIAIPFYLSSRGYGLLWNMPGDGEVTLTNTSTNLTSTAQRQIDFWVTAGSARRALGSYSQVAGPAPPLPEHAAGFWQSKCRYKTQARAYCLVHVRQWVMRGLSLSYPNRCSSLPLYAGGAARRARRLRAARLARRRPRGRLPSVGVLRGLHLEPQLLA